MKREKKNDTKHAPTGVVVIQPTPHCDLYYLLAELEASQYEMIDAFCQERENTSDRSGKSVHYVARYTFCRREDAEIFSKTFWEMQKDLLAELEAVCRQALWRVRTYQNPFYKDGVEVHNEHTISINMEVREPFHGPDGQSIELWLKDENGERMGDAPLPMRGVYALNKTLRSLHVENDTLVLM
ncbi:MAG: hypothetical protein AAB920_03270 [Patescibacteria group bacterium]